MLMTITSTVLSTVNSCYKPLTGGLLALPNTVPALSLLPCGAFALILFVFYAIYCNNFCVFYQYYLPSHQIVLPMELYSIDFDYETDIFEDFFESECIERFIVPALPQHIFDNNSNNINYNTLEVTLVDDECERKRPCLKRSLSPFEYYWMDIASPNVNGIHCRIAQANRLSLSLSCR